MVKKGLLGGLVKCLVDTLIQKYLYRDYFKAELYTVWVHGPVGFKCLKSCFMFPTAGRLRGSISCSAR